MNDARILDFSRNCFENAFDVPYPEGFRIVTKWIDIQKKNYEAIRNFNNAMEAIIYAQDGSMSGFDSRRNMHGRGRGDSLHFLHFKAQELERTFPGFTLKGHPNLRESHYSDPGSLVEIQGISYSSAFLTNLSFCLRSILTFGQESRIKRIVEIGGGYGASARIFKILNPSVRYVLIDLPESLFFTQVFINLNFPEAKTRYVNSKKKIDVDQYDFIFVPVQFCESIAGGDFDIAIDTRSLQEMPTTTVKYWMNFIENIINVKMFYSFNYFLNDKVNLHEKSGAEASLMCPILDPFWRVKYFKINPVLITKDSSSRNYLELCAWRIDSTQRNETTLIQQASALFNIAEIYPKGSNDWFANMWMSYWLNPAKETAQALLEGIGQFKNGKVEYPERQNTTRNNTTNSILCDPSSLRELARMVKRITLYWYRIFLGTVMKRSKYRRRFYGEELFYMEKVNV